MSKDEGLSSRADSGKQEWRCFHCDDIFTDREAAADHFGIQIDGLADEPGCKLNQTEGGILKMLREANAELAKYRQEDDAQTRMFYALGAEHTVALRREEEKGYARGLANGQALVAPRSERGAWISAENKPKDDGLYIVRDIDGQMAFASFTTRYGWEHIADNDCGAVTAWHPLPSERKDSFKEKA